MSATLTYTQRTQYVARVNELTHMYNDLLAKYRRARASGDYSLREQVTAVAAAKNTLVTMLLRDARLRALARGSTVAF